MADTLMACPICGDGEAELFATAYDKEYFTSEQPWRYARCPRCTAVYLHEPPADRLGEIYPDNYYSYGGIAETSITERIKEWLDRRTLRRTLERVPGEKLRVLDVGGGEGWLLGTVRRACDRVVETHEVDLQEDAAAVAQAAGHIYHRMPVEEFVSDDRFDLILMMSIIEHVADPRAVLVSMSRLLSDDGVLLLKTPNTDTLDCRLFRRHNWGGFHCPRHFVLFTERGLRALGDEVGLEVASCTYTQGAPQWAISVMAWLSDRGLIRVTRERPAYTNRVYEPLLAVFAAVDYARVLFSPTAQMVVQFTKKREVGR